MIKEWDLVELVSPSNEIENTQPTASRPAGAVSSLMRCAVAIFASSLATSALISSHAVLPASSTSQTVCVLSQLKLRTGRNVRPPRDGTIQTEQILPVARTSRQLAKSFKSMLRPVDPAEYIDSDYTFG